MLTTIWDDFLTILKEEVGSSVVETWFKAVSLQDWDASTNTVCLHIPNKFVLDWVKKHYMNLMQVHLGRLLHVEMPTVVLINVKEKTASLFLS